MKENKKCSNEKTTEIETRDGQLKETEQTVQKGKGKEQVKEMEDTKERCHFFFQIFCLSFSGRLYK